MSEAPWKHRRWLGILRESFGGTFWAFTGLAAALATVCYYILGPEVFASAVKRDRELLESLLPRLVAAQIVAGMIWVLLPREALSRLLGAPGSQRGLVIATIAGIITPGGPASAFPLLAIAAASGADVGILVTYITSWAMLGVQRILVWDVPFMGAEFSTLRFVVCLPLPLLAGILARRLPLEVTFKNSGQLGGDGK